MEEKLLKRLNACVRCGLCIEDCPIFAEKEGEWESANARGKIAIGRAYLEKLINVDDFLLQELYRCPLCMKCEMRCPAELNICELIVQIRALLVDKGKLPSTIKAALRNVLRYGNPWGESRNRRSEWMKGLKQEIKDVPENERSSLLFFVGSAPSYDTRLQNTARSLVKCLTRADVSFEVLGREENCCGNEVYEMGEMGLFELLAESNEKLFHRYGIEEIVTISPHCYQVFIHKYRGKLKAYHHSQFVLDLIEKGKVTFLKKIKKKVIYQDACFLGRRNGIYEEPRKIIEHIPGIELVEFDKSKEEALCCEGGGGRMWFDDGKARLGDIKVKEALDKGAEILVTACPFCLSNLDEAVKNLGKEDLIEVKDLIELVEEAT